MVKYVCGVAPFCRHRDDCTTFEVLDFSKDPPEGWTGRFTKIVSSWALHRIPDLEKSLRSIHKYADYEHLFRCMRM